MEVICPLKDQFTSNTSADNCVRFKWNNVLASTFFPKQSNWKHIVNEVITSCLSQSAVERVNGSCNSPILNVTFPWISRNPSVPLQILHRPVLAIKTPSFGTGRQVLSALKQIWRLFVLSIMAAVLSGIVIWFLVSV